MLHLSGRNPQWVGTDERGRELEIVGVFREAHTSPQVAFRIPADLRERAEKVAEAEGITVSALAREALENYVASH